MMGEMSQREWEMFLIRVPGIGERMAQRLIEHFGERIGETLDRGEPARLQEVRGLKLDRAERLIAAWRERRAAKIA